MCSGVDADENAPPATVSPAAFGDAAPMTVGLAGFAALMEEVLPRTPCFALNPCEDTKP